MGSVRLLFQSQYGVAGQDQLLAAGMTKRQVASAVTEGRLKRSGRWALIQSSWLEGGGGGGRLPSELWKHNVYVALFSCHPRLRPLAFAHRGTAAVPWGLDGTQTERAAVAPVQLGISAGHPYRPAFSRTRPVPPGELACIDGLPVTSIVRTLVDLGQVADKDVVERALEAALRKKLVRAEELSKALEAAPLRGTGALRQLIASRPPGLVPTESDAETLLVQLVRRAGLPPPERQFLVPTNEGNFRVDFAWPLRRIAAEVDGQATHGSAEALVRDLRRQNRLLLLLAPAGWLLLRFTWADVALGRFAGQTMAKLREAWALGAAGIPGSLRAPAPDPRRVLD